MCRNISLASLLIGVLLTARMSNAADPASILKMPAGFSDNMVLQRDLANPIWGHAAPNTAVTVTFADQKKTTTADAQGQWKLKLDPMPASADGRPLAIISNGETRAFTNVLVGEVWLASGQSNMEKPIGEHAGQKPTITKII